MDWNKTTKYLTTIVFGALFAYIIISNLFKEISEQQIYLEIGFLVLVAAFGEYATQKYKVPSVLVLMLLGLFLSNSSITLVWNFLGSLNLPMALPSQAPQILGVVGLMKVFAVFGAVVFLFKVGLEHKREEIFKKDNFLTAFFGAVVPFITGFSYIILLGGDLPYALFVGAALTGTNLGVNIAVLRQRKMLGTSFAKRIIGSAVIDDMFGLFVLSLVLNLAFGINAPELAITIVTIFFFIIGGFVVGEMVVSYTDKQEFNEYQFLLILGLVLLFSYMAETVKVSGVVGAFIAGTLLNKSKHLDKILGKVKTVEFIFMPVFFLSLGMAVDINAIITYSVPILIITALAFASKIVGCYIAGVSQGEGHLENLLIGVAMAPRGAIGLIVASIGLASGALDITQFSILSTMSVLTSLIVTPVLDRLITIWMEKNKIKRISSQ